MKCICCGRPDDLLEGYCLDCAAQKLKQYALLKSNLDVALEPVRHWYGEVVVHIVADVVADLQKDRAEALRLGKQITHLNRAIAQVQEQRTNISRQLGRSEENLAELRTEHTSFLQLANRHKQIGWWSLSSKRFCYLNANPAVMQHFTKRVFILKECDAEPEPQKD